MKIIVTITSLMFFINSALAQIPKTHVVEIQPKQPLLQAKFDKQIAGLTDETAVLKVVYPQVARLNLYISLYVYKGQGEHVDLIFNPSKLRAGGNAKLVFESKGAASMFISRPEDFAVLPDTLALLDTLKLRIRYNSNGFPISDYYIRWKGTGKSPLREQQIKPGPGQTLPVIADAGKYHPFELRNLGTDNRILLKSYFYLVSAAQQKDLKQLVTAFISSDSSGYTQQSVNALVVQYLTVRYGKPIDEQVREWVAANFKDLQP